MSSPTLGADGISTVEGHPRLAEILGALPVRPESLRLEGALYPGLRFRKPRYRILEHFSERFIWIPIHSVRHVGQSNC